jgi:CheY-like chemotaxis protein
MSNNRMIFIGEKESFIARVLMKKVNDTGAECVFVPWTIKEINANIEDASLIALYMDAGIRPDEDIIHFISDKLEEYSHQIIIIGEQEDTEHIRAHFPGEHVYMTFSRPVDNKRFAEAVTEYFEKADLGMFKRSILIVDDDPQYLTMVREWLKGTYKVAMANSGLQAIKWLGKNKVDLILLDHEMPVTSGPQVLEMLRSDEETRSIPVMFLTGKRDKESVMAVVALRPEGYFLKDIKKDELLEKLGEFFILHK